MNCYFELLWSASKNDWQDDRAETSWTARIGDVSWVESLEVQVVNVSWHWSFKPKWWTVNPPASCRGYGALCSPKQIESLLAGEGARIFSESVRSEIVKNHLQTIFSNIDKNTFFNISQPFQNQSKTIKSKKRIHFLVADFFWKVPGWTLESSEHPRVLGAHHWPAAGSTRRLWCQWSLAKKKALWWLKHVEKNWCYIILWQFDGWWCETLCDFVTDFFPQDLLSLPDTGATWRTRFRTAEGLQPPTAHRGLAGHSDQRFEPVPRDETRERPATAQLGDQFCQSFIFSSLQRGEPKKKPHLKMDFFVYNFFVHFSLFFQDSATKSLRAVVWLAGCKKRNRHNWGFVVSLVIGPSWGPNLGTQNPRNDDILWWMWSFKIAAAALPLLFLSSTGRPSVRT